MFLLISMHIVFTQAHIIHMNLPKINITQFNSTLHLSFGHIKRICKNSDVICKSNDSSICSVRYDKDGSSYKDFENTCYLFMSNMCNSPGFEYSIISSGTCEQYFNARRTEMTAKQANQTVSLDGSNTTTKLSTVNSLRSKQETTFSTLYEVETAFDFHICPYSCPDIYSPICVSANRGFGKYFKFFTFVNHCAGDLYYCKHWEEFSPPPDEDEKVSSSPLSWSYCGASRYLQFARFAEVASSMGHYGWLAGDYRYSHIMEPHERAPGFG
ncbi:uncharacterized protein LOC115447706 isoform X1 [Manduca sexta]|uniref:uncharacterized protein LOC115447706 isoform X1 n=1 Tax=Manduca sexta TaxID=7130 RepID=UPI0018907C93|nr:uncharacterized protein LOC115447706 isoform X1 [Manduca sexta]